MDADGDHAVDNFSEVYRYDDDIYVGEDEEGHDSRYQELLLEDEYEEDFADDQMVDHEEFGEEEGGIEEEEYPAYDDQLDEEIANDQNGVQLENELVDFNAEEENQLDDRVSYWYEYGYGDSAEPFPPTRPRHIYFDSESSDSDGDDGSDSGLCGEWLKCGGSNVSSWKGFQGPICSICFKRWKEEGRHCVCCLPCGHIYGMSCIMTWLERPDSRKCPQCKQACEVADIKRLYGMQLATPKVEELQEKVEHLEAKCADLEMKDADWLRKEAEWQRREADLQQQLNQHKQAEAGPGKDARIRGGTCETTKAVKKQKIVINSDVLYGRIV